MPFFLGRKKVLLYAQDGIGLGHLRRLSRIAESLQTTYSTLLVSGKREVSWIVPDKCEYIHIPSWSSLGLGLLAKNTQKWLDIDQKSAISLVRSFCEAIERIYKPDCIIVDHTLGGMFGELHELIIRSSARKYMIMRGITDTEDIRRFEQQDPAILNAFDRILVTCDSRTSDFRKEDSRIPSFVPKTKHVGYVLPKKVDATLIREQNAIAQDQLWIVCSAGGGTNAEVFLNHCIEIAPHFKNVFFDVVLGPYSKLNPDAYTNVGNCRVRKVVEDLPEIHSACDVAVLNGGYNSLFESISGGARILVFPNQTNSEGDQITHSRRLAQYYPITILDSVTSLKSQLGVELQALEHDKLYKFALDCSGLENIKKIIDADLRVI